MKAWPSAVAFRPGGRCVPFQAPAASILDPDLRIEKGRRFSKIWHTPRYRVAIALSAETRRNAGFLGPYKQLCPARKLGQNYASLEFAERYFLADPRIALEPRKSAIFVPRLA